MRILHISDLHFGFHHFQAGTEEPKEGVHLDPPLHQGIPAVLDTTIDAIVISGDVTQAALPAEFDVAAQEIRQLAMALNVELKNVVVTPGNHDINWALADADRKRRFEPWRAFLRDLYTPRLADQLYPPHEPFVAVHRVRHAAIASLSSCLFESRQNRYGYVGAEQLQRLGRSMGGVTEPWRIAVMHHHLLPSPQESIPSDPSSDAQTSLDPSIVRDSGVVLNALGRMHFNVVLHGHKHDPARRLHAFVDDGKKLEGMYILGAGSTGVNVRELPPRRSHHAQILELQENGPARLYELRAGDMRWEKENRAYELVRLDELSARVQQLSAQVSMLERELAERDTNERTTAPLRYDELEALQQDLQGVHLKATNLLGALRAVASRHRDWSTKRARGLMTTIRDMELVFEADLETAYWHLIVLGVLRFKDIDYWWDDEETWENSVDYAKISRRGAALLNQLSAAGEAPTDPL